MMLSSANKFFRKGCTSSNVSGPPRLSSSTPIFVGFFSDPLSLGPMMLPPSVLFAGGSMIADSFPVAYDGFSAVPKEQTSCNLGVPLLPWDLKSTRAQGVIFHSVPARTRKIVSLSTIIGAPCSASSPRSLRRDWIAAAGLTRQPRCGQGRIHNLRKSHRRKCLKNTPMDSQIFK